MKVVVDGKENRISVDPGNGRGILNDEEFKLEISEDGPYVYHVGWNGKNYNVQVLPGDDEIHPRIRVNGNTFNIELIDKFDELLKELGMEILTVSKVKDIKSPMPGLIVKILKQVGDDVEVGDPIILLEAMKMENEIRASASGIIKTISTKENSSVEKGQSLLEIG